MPTATSAKARAAGRFGVGMAYTLASGMQGYTRDLSATGLSFDSDVPYAVGSIVQLTLRYGACLDPGLADVQRFTTAVFHRDRQRDAEPRPSPSRSAEPASA